MTLVAQWLALWALDEEAPSLIPGKLNLDNDIF